MSFIRKSVEYFVIVGGTGIKSRKRRREKSFSRWFMVRVLLILISTRVSFLLTLIGNIEEEFVLSVIFVRIVFVIRFFATFVIVWKLVA